MKFIVWILLALLGSTTAHAQATYVAQIHNAPGWAPDTTYKYSSGPPTAPFTRVLAGAGWTPSGKSTLLTGKRAGGSGTWNPGLPLNAYELTSEGTCTSAPGGTGPSGIGSSIIDGTCTWKYLSGVDYVSLTGWILDGGSAWASGTDYGWLDVVQAGPDLSVYQQTSAGCHSTVQPTGTLAVEHNQYGKPPTGQSTGDGCFWNYIGKVYYSSRTPHKFPMATFNWSKFTGSISGTTLTVTAAPVTYPLTVGQTLNAPGITGGTQITALGNGSGGLGTYTVSVAQTIRSQTIFASEEYTGKINSDALYVASLWNDREYVSGLNGENAPIQVWNHNYHYNDVKDPVATGLAASMNLYFGFPITIQAAPGESFADTLAANPQVPLTGYNANYGVAIRGTGLNVPGLLMTDNFIVLHGLQVTASTSFAVSEAPTRACNICTFEHNIFEGAVDAPAIIDCGAQCYHHNNLYVAHGKGAILLDYGGRIYNSTIVCPEATCAIAIQDTWHWITAFGVAMRGNAIFGFQHLVATAAPVLFPNCLTQTTNPCEVWNGSNNATDVSPTDGADYPAATIPYAYTGGWTTYVQNFATGSAFCGADDPTGATFIPGTCGIMTSVPPRSVFVAWPGNYKINNGSPLFGAGASYGTYNLCGQVTTSLGRPAKWPGCVATADTPDILGMARPQGTRYDIGAIELQDVRPGGRLPR